LDDLRCTNDFFTSGSLEIKKYLRYKNTITNASAVVFKKAKLEKEKLPVEMRFCGDWAIWIELLKKGDVVYVSEPLNYFRRHEQSTKSIKSFSLEKARLKEYFSIIYATSTFMSRLLNLKKYTWIFVEMNVKETKLNQTLCTDLPIEFKWLKRKYKK